MNQVTIRRLQHLVEAMEAVRRTEDQLLSLQEKLKATTMSIGTGTLGVLPLMELVPIVRFGETNERLLRAVRSIVTEELNL